MFDVTCVACDTQLVHDPRQTDIGDGVIHHHYRCPADECSADGGVVTTSNGRITQLRGAAVDPKYSRPDRETDQRLATDGGRSGGIGRGPRDGESTDKSGDIRPVPPGVPNRPEGLQ